MPQDVDVLQSQLDNLLRIAKLNEQKQNNFQEYELSLLNANGLDELFTIILEQHRERFNLSDVTLLLLDPEYEFRRLLDVNPAIPPWRKHLLFTESTTTINQYFSVLRKPKLTRYAPYSHQFLFPNAHAIQSVAILPLIRHNQFIGALNLGSRSPSRFQSNMGTQFLQHLAAVISACIDNARLQENIKQVGLLDPLTGINNRRFFDQRVSEEVTLAKRQHSSLACLFVDLDYFKKINDEYGHQAGDTILKKVAQSLAEIMRTSDVLARYGGEEFVILLANTEQQAARDIAERIRKTIADARYHIDDNTQLSITLSIGLAIMDKHAPIHNASQLISHADQAVYSAKMAGRNQVHIATVSQTQ